MGLMQRALAALDATTNPQSPAAPVAEKQAGPLDGLKALVSADMESVNSVIIEQLDCEEPLIRVVGEHIMKAGGKRLRPSLTLASAKLCGYEGSRHIQLASAVELIHTATLLHDDVVDESHLRRGLATANDLWGNKASVLVGDFLLSRAFQLMVKDGSLKVLKILSDVSAVISQGEVMQLSIAGQPETQEEAYFKVIGAKTAALFAAGCEIGAVVAEKEADEAPLRDFGMKLGIAFQMMDDALDYAAEQTKLGKTVGDDFREGKITLPVILAYQDGNAAERAFWLRCLQEQDQQEGDLEEAMRLMDKHQTISRSVARAEDIVTQAKACIAHFPANAARDVLYAVADFSVARSH